MKIQPSVYAQALTLSLDAPPAVQKERVGRFIRLLQKKRMRKLLPLILRSLETRSMHNSLIVESAVPLTDTFIEDNAPRIREIINASPDSQILPRVNTDVVGGIKITYNNSEYDATLRRQLDTMEEQLWQQ